jgi:hypothetical protein
MRDRVRGLTIFRAGVAVTAGDEVQDVPTGTPEADPIDPTDDAAEDAEVAPAETGTAPRGYKMRPIDLAAVVAAILVVLVVVIIIAKGDKTTPKVAAVAQPSAAPTWLYKDLHGTPVIVTAGKTGSSRFMTVADGKRVPLAVAAVQAASQNHNCAAMKESYDNWLGPATTGASANYKARASAYARYSLDTARADHCAWVATVG